MDITGAASKSKNNSFMSKSTGINCTTMDAIVTLEDNDYEECIKTTMQVYKSRGVQCVLEHENHSDHFPRSPSINSNNKSGFKLNREKFKYNGKPANYIHVPKVDCDSLDKWQHDMYYKLEGIEVEEEVAAIPDIPCKCKQRRDVYKPPMLRNCDVCGSTAGELPNPRAPAACTARELSNPKAPSFKSTAGELPDPRVPAACTSREPLDSRASSYKSTAGELSDPRVPAACTSREPLDFRASSYKSTAGELSDPRAPAACSSRELPDPRASTTKETTSTVESDVMKYVTQRRNRLSGSPKSQTKEQVKVEDKSPSKVLGSSKIETKNELTSKIKKIETREEFFKSMEFVVKPYTGDGIRVRHDINVFDVLDEPDTPKEIVPPPPTGPIENKLQKAVDEYKIKVTEKLRIQNLRREGIPPSPTTRQHFFPFQPQPFVPIRSQGYYPQVSFNVPRVSQQYRLFKHKPNGAPARYTAERFV